MVERVPICAPDRYGLTISWSCRSDLRDQLRKPLGNSSCVAALQHILSEVRADAQRNVWTRCLIETLRFSHHAALKRFVLRPVRTSRTSVVVLAGHLDA